MLCLLPEHKQPRLARHRRDVFDPLSDRPRSPITPPLISPRSPFPLPIFIRIFTAGLRRSPPVLHLTAGAPFLHQVPPSSSSFQSLASFCILLKKHASLYLMVRPTSSST
ncbi:hypothetical protein BHE74_00059506 [Ensete ventricosum]|uniref:Uncharacterized protein n=1 Tax=Ensete ventricosum TaxID=4639 RepID=A0A426XK88_ENSVE|nr:hypothetical protein B296_00055721 [Ensete ventricosum]RWW35548.1 hypothetical protein BHE74_00059506 [Ensete ventricosum]